MLSVSVVSTTCSATDVLVMVTLKVTGPPGSGSVVGLGVLVALMVGGTSVSRTVAVSVARATVPSSSTPVTVTVSVWVALALPVKMAWNEQE